jgi:hypothetical protein
MAQDATDRDTQLTRLQSLRDEHRSLDERINSLSSQAYLSPDDQIEIARLKKMKLRKKDEIFAVASNLGVEI